MINLSVLRAEVMTVAPKLFNCRANFAQIHEEAPMKQFETNANFGITLSPFGHMCSNAIIKLLVQLALGNKRAVHYFSPLW